MYKSNWGYIFLTLSVFMILTACSSNPPHNQGAPSGLRGTEGTRSNGGSSSVSNGPSGTSLTAKNVGSGTTPAGTHHNTMMGVNGVIANQITSLPGIKSAYVVATESNIYVAVRLKDDYQAPAGRIPATMNQDQHTTTPRGDIISGITGNSYDMKQPEDGNMTSSHDVPAETKQKIVDKVRSLSDPSLHHVYVSANPDFRTILESYTHDVKQGKSISGAIDDFNILAQRIFPTTDGTGAYGGSTSSGGPGKVYGNSGDTILGTSRHK